jgi:hypothetical protein
MDDATTTLEDAPAASKVRHWKVFLDACDVKGKLVNLSIFIPHSKNFA